MRSVSGSDPQLVVARTAGRPVGDRQVLPVAAKRDSVLPPLRPSDGAVEGLKWLGVVLMTLDHIDKYLLQERESALFALGRLAFPIFGTVLAYNLARPGARERGVYGRLLRRLALVGVIGEVPFVALGGLAWAWYPLNVLVALWIATAVIGLIDAGGAWRIALAVTLFVVGGALVEFWWPGILLCVSAWAYCRRPNAWALGVWVAATVALYVINRNFWALAAFPLIFYAPHARWAVPRIRWAFYIYYPAHLALLFGLSRTLRAG